MDDNNDKINWDHFFWCYDDTINFVENKCLDRIEGVIILCCCLDSLAGYRYGGTSRKNRFQQFLVEHSNQADIWRKVSVIRLRQELEARNHEYYQNMINFLRRQGAITSNYSGLDYNPDVDYDTLMNKASESLSKDYLESLNKDILEFEYSSILWNDYRNQAIHERTLGNDKAINIGDKTIPYYSNEIPLKGGKIQTKTHFAIPPCYILETLKNCIAGFKKYIEENKITILPRYKYFNTNGFELQDRVDSKNKENVNPPYMLTKPFITLLKDAGYLLIEAKKCKERYLKEKNPDDKYLENAFSRSCIILSMFFLETLIDNVIEDFKVHETYQLPYSLKTKLKLHVYPLNRLPLVDRIYVTPYLCIKDSNSFMTKYFKRGSANFQKLKELIQIRNYFAHGKPFKRKLDIKSTGSDTHIVNDNFKENFWPLTGIPKDIFIIGYDDAKKAKEIVESTIEKLNIYLDSRLCKNKWLSGETIQLSQNGLESQ